MGNSPHPLPIPFWRLLNVAGGLGGEGEGVYADFASGYNWEQIVIYCEALPWRIVPLYVTRNFPSFISIFLNRGHWVINRYEWSLNNKSVSESSSSCLPKYNQVNENVSHDCLEIVHSHLAW